MSLPLFVQIRCTPGRTYKVAEEIAKKYGIVRSAADQMVKQAGAVNRSFITSLAGNSGMLIGLGAAALFVIFYATR